MQFSVQTAASDLGTVPTHPQQQENDSAELVRLSIAEYNGVEPANIVRVSA